MCEKILQTKKNGMAMLLLILLGYVAAVAVFVACGVALDGAEGAAFALAVAGIVAACVYIIAGFFLLAGLKVLKPQEALVLTLFGDYIGTLKGEGFYWVNPFCTAVNPAAGTRLSQSGDVQSGDGAGLAAMLGKEAVNQAAAKAAAEGKRISL